MSKRLFVLILTMVIVGFVIPSPGIGSPGPGYQDRSQYHPLSTPSTPELLIVPSIQLRAPVVPIQVQPNGILYPPDDYHEVGFLTASAKPGSATGQTVITGHTVHTGGGVMNQLGDMRPGALIQIRTKHGIVDYVATDVFVYTKTQVAKHKQELFSQDRAQNRLVLITCTGWTGSIYTSNIIVFGDPLGVRNTAAGVQAGRMIREQLL